MAFESAAAATAVAVTTSEATVLASPAVAEQVPAPYGVIVEAYGNYSPAATGVAVTLRIRQGAAVGGAQVGTSDVSNGLANPNSYTVGTKQIFPAGSALPYGNQFNVTAQGTTAGGTLNNVVIVVRAINPSGGPS